jgi:hypothetical protein
MDDYNFFGGHAYFGSPLGGLHTYKLTLSLYSTAYITTWWHYLQKHHICKYLHRSYNWLCTSLLLRNKNSSKKKKKKKISIVSLHMVSVSMYITVVHAKPLKIKVLLLVKCKAKFKH